MGDKPRLHFRAGGAGEYELERWLPFADGGGASGHRFPWADADTIQHDRANYNSLTDCAYDSSPTRGFHPTFNDGVEPYRQVTTILGRVRSHCILFEISEFFCGYSISGF